MIANAALRALLDQPPTGEVVVPYDYVMFVAGGFKDVEGCLFFREFALGQTVAVGLPRFGDATGYEASVNGHRLTDYMSRDPARDSVTLAHTTLACARYLARRLRSTPGAACRVIFSVSNKHSTLRFHRLRDDEKGWLSDNLDGYEEAVGYLDSTDEDLGADEPASAALS